MGTPARWLLACVAPAILAARGFAQDVEFVLEPDAERPAEYVWSRPGVDGASPAAVPFLTRTSVARIAPGEVGVEARTRSYLPLNAGSGVTARDVAVGADVSIGSATWGPGRFGHGLTLPPGVEFAGPPAGSPEGTDDASWTVEFWFRADEPTPEPGARLLAIDGQLEVLWTRAGRIRVRLDAEHDEQLSLWSRGVTRPGEWSHVAVVREAAPLWQLRLIFDGEVRAKPLPEGVARRAAERVDRSSAGVGLVLGGSEAAPVLRFDEVRWVGRALPSAELLAREEPIAPGLHRLTLRAESSAERSLEFWQGAIRRAELRPAELALGELVHARVTGNGLQRIATHWQRDLPAPGPPARTTHPTIGLGGRVWIFGGEVRDTHVGRMVNLADTWTYDLEQARWDAVSPGLAPPPSCHQAAAFSPDHGLVLYAGGWRNDDGRDELRSSTWVYDVASERWSERQPGGDALLPTAGAPLVYHPPTRRFVLFRSDALWTYDPEANLWERLSPPFAETGTGEPILWRPGTSAMAETLPDGRVFLFGGERPGSDGEMHFLGDTVLYDPVSHTYRVLDLDVAPAPRVRSAFAFDERRGRLVLYGGVLGQDSERFDDLWTFDVARERWSRHETPGGPGPRGGYYGMARDAERDLFVVACGRASRSRFADDIWRLRFSDDEPGRARYVLDRSEFPELDRLVVGWQGKADAVKVRTRTSSGDGRWSPWTGNYEAPADRLLAVELLLPADEPAVVTSIRLVAGTPDLRAEKSAVVRLR